MDAPSMQMGIREALFMLSTAFALPTIAVLTFAYFSGSLKRTEDARCLPVMEPDFDWWETPATKQDSTTCTAVSPPDALRAGDAR